MKITIAQRLRPFSRTPGARCVIPGTHLILEAYPALLRIGSLEIPIDPIRDFILIQDLEKNCVWASGHRITATQDGIQIGQRRYPLPTPFSLPTHTERLSLGSHKSQDWDLVLRRFDLKEILPPLFALGQKTPPLPPQPHTGTARLLDLDLKVLCRAAFHHILVPRLKDDQHQGLCSPEDPSGHPFYLIQEATRRIRSLLFREEESRFHLLPNCPFPSGRLIGLQTSFGHLDLEWTKGKARRAILHAAKSGEVVFGQALRWRTNGHERGRKHTSSEPLIVEAGRTYFLDRFQLEYVDRVVGMNL